MMARSWYTQTGGVHSCEGCGEKILKSEPHYAVLIGVSQNTIVVPERTVYYHRSHLDPYMITLWLQEGQTVSISHHVD